LPRIAPRWTDIDVRSQLPIRATITGVTLLVEQPSGRWERSERFPLGRQ
jgi:hypothetical protein